MIGVVLAVAVAVTVAIFWSGLLCGIYMFVHACAGFSVGCIDMHRMRCDYIVL